tara:strand:+ start:1190 stop:1456 length:267 start_codon:yes stop_codon:yes gene_type:complete
MYITLSLTPDRNGFQGQVALNTQRINGFREIPFRDIAGNVEKDEAGYVGTYTEVLMKGCSVHVTDTISEILEKVGEAKNESWITQPNV